MTVCRALLAHPLDLPMSSGAGFEPPGDEAIGRVAFVTHRGEDAEAILGKDGTWRCPKLPVLERPLNLLYAPKPVERAEDFGRDEVRRVAHWFRARRPEGENDA